MGTIVPFRRDPETETLPARTGRENGRAIRATQVAMCRSMSGLELMSHILDFHPDPPNAEPWLDDLAHALWGVSFQAAYYAWHLNVLERRK